MLADPVALDLKITELVGRVSALERAAPPSKTCDAEQDHVCEGCVVVLSHRATQRGCLLRSKTGVVVQALSKTAPVKVRGDRGETSWYYPSEIIRLVEGCSPTGSPPSPTSPPRGEASPPPIISARISPPRSPYVGSPFSPGHRLQALEKRIESVEGCGRSPVSSLSDAIVFTKALLIGVDHTASRKVTEGNCRGVLAMADHLTSRGIPTALLQDSFPPPEALLNRSSPLPPPTTPQPTPPTKHCVEDCLRWLVQDAVPSDTLLVAFAGVGDDGWDVIDDESCTDVELHEKLLAPLPPGTRLWIVSDIGAPHTFGLQHRTIPTPSEGACAPRPRCEVVVVSGGRRGVVPAMLHALQSLGPTATYTDLVDSLSDVEPVLCSSFPLPLDEPINLLAPTRDSSIRPTPYGQAPPAFPPQSLSVERSPQEPCGESPPSIQSSRPAATRTPADHLKLPSSSPGLSEPAAPPSLTASGNQGSFGSSACPPPAGTPLGSIAGTLNATAVKEQGTPVSPALQPVHKLDLSAWGA